MKKEILICDTCVTQNDVASFRIATGCEMDPSGNGYNTVWVYKEFCPTCLTEYQLQHKDFKIQKT